MLLVGYMLCISLSMYLGLDVVSTLPSAMNAHTQLQACFCDTANVLSGRVPDTCV